ncbi:MAG TPA: helix-turn-helix transcriptional regulator [Thermoanaerobaculia bacterium]|nr:helix-turn-helix transcriptional regulator [Thermoanaerobaculia bacterium]
MEIRLQEHRKDRRFGKEMGRRIQMLREARGWTQIRLAIELGVDAPMVSRYEKGHHTPSAKCLKLLGSLLGVTVDYLVGAVPPERPARLGDALADLLKKLPGVPDPHRNSLARLIESFLDTFGVPLKGRDTVQPARGIPPQAFSQEK